SSAIIEKGPIRDSAVLNTDSPCRRRRARNHCAIPRGITMYITTDNINVSHGTGMDDTPSNNATMGAKANTMMRSLMATWLKVKLALPLQRLLHTNTIAVQGAAPNRMSPAT